MSRKILVALTAAIGGLSLVAVGGGAAAPKVVRGTVGPGFTIGLTLAGEKVSRLKAGTVYRLVVADRSSAHDFHLTGPGVNKVLTDVGFTGSKSAVVTLRKGTYRFVCDPHSSSMRGTFTVS